MNHVGNGRNRRILVVDDNETIHEDFRKVLTVEDGTDPLADDEATLFGGEGGGVGVCPAAVHVFEVDSAYQGQEALAMVRQARADGRPYAMAFVDVRMPPGWDGIETIAHLWPADPDLQVVICTAYSDYSWDQMIEKLGVCDRLLILRKPFEHIEVRQLAVALTEKWELARRAQMKLKEVEHLVEIRTRDLQQAHGEISRARDEAEAASKAKSDFLANVSHEVRTPMTAILGYAEILLDPEQPEAQRSDAARTIHRNGEYLLAVINDILDISKIEAGKLAVERLVCPPDRLIADVSELVRDRAESHGLTFDVETVPPIPETIQTDPTRLRQILINLIGNAIKFTATGGVRLVTRLIHHRDTEPALQFDIVDTGIGMTQEQAAGVFQPFHQADTSTTRRFGGTGLGLHISKRLAQLLGGDVVIIETRSGAGTRIRVTVPAGPLDGIAMVTGRADPSTTPVVGPPASTEAVSLNGCRLLLAEDGPDNQRLITFVLSKAGADVTVAENGKVAVDAVQAAEDVGRPFDVVLMDMQMPVMDGYEAASLLRSRGYANPIVALTAHAMTGDREKCIEAGCDDYETKPIRRDALIRKIAAWARKS